MANAVAVEIPPRGAVRPLYELTDERAFLLSVLEQLDTAEHQEAVDAIYTQLEANNLSIEERCEACAASIRNAQGEAAMCTQERNRLQTRIGCAETRIQRIKAYLMRCLSAAGLQRVKAGLWRVNVQANGGKQPIDRTRIEAELAFQLVEGKPAETIVSGVRVGYRPYLIIDEEQLPAEYRLERGQHMRIT